MFVGHPLSPFPSFEEPRRWVGKSRLLVLRLLKEFALTAQGKEVDGKPRTLLSYLKGREAFWGEERRDTIADEPIASVKVQAKGW